MLYAGSSIIIMEQGGEGDLGKMFSYWVQLGKKFNLSLSKTECFIIAVLKLYRYEKIHRQNRPGWPSGQRSSLAFFKDSHPALTQVLIPLGNNLTAIEIARHWVA